MISEANPISGLDIPPNAWVSSTWETFLQTTLLPEYSNAKFYYYDYQLRIEMTPIGADHASDNTLVAAAISLLCTIRGIPLKGFTNCSYRKVRIRECQPDISYYVGDRTKLAPKGSAVVDLDVYAPPDLVVEIADTTFADDLGIKRLLYENLGIREYWVVNGREASIVAFAIIAEQTSQRITRSQVLVDFDLALLEESLRRSRKEDDTNVLSWLMRQIQSGRNI